VDEYYVEIYSIQTNAWLNTLASRQVIFYDCSLLSENVTSIKQITVAYVETLSFREQTDLMK